MKLTVQQKTGRQLAELINLDLLPIKEETLEKILSTLENLLPFDFVLSTSVVNVPCRRKNPEGTSTESTNSGSNELVQDSTLTAPKKVSAGDCGCGCGDCGGGNASSSTTEKSSPASINPDPGFLTVEGAPPLTDEIAKRGKLCCKFKEAKLIPTGKQVVKVDRTAKVPGLLDGGFKGSVSFEYFLVPDHDILGRTICGSGCCDDERRRISVQTLLTCELSINLKIIDFEKLFGSEAKSVDVSVLGEATKIRPAAGVSASAIDATSVAAQDLNGGSLELKVAVENLAGVYDFIHSCNKLIRELKTPEVGIPGVKTEPEKTDNGTTSGETPAPEPIYDQKDNCEICELDFRLTEFLFNSKKLVEFIEQNTWPRSNPNVPPTPGTGGILNHASDKIEQGGWITARKLSERAVGGKIVAKLRYRLEEHKNDIPANRNRISFPLLKSEFGLSLVPVLDEPGRCILCHFHTHPNLLEEFSFSQQAVFGDGGASDIDFRVAQLIGLPFFIRGRDKNGRDCYFLYDIDCTKQPKVAFKKVQKIFALDLVKHHQLKNLPQLK